MRVVYALWLRNLKNFVRDRTRLIISLIIPFFFIYVFSSIFKNENVENPQAFMLAGVIIVIVFQTSLSVATSTIEDLVSGFMKEVLVSPANRFCVALGQILSAATISSIQGTLILIIGFVTGIRFTSIMTPIYVFLSMILVGIVFSSFGLFLSTKVKNAQTFQIVQQAVVLPFTFLSGAYLPLSLLPKPLRLLSRINPMTYTAAFFRTVVLEKSDLTTQEFLNMGLAFNVNGFTITPLISGLFVAIFGLIFLILSTRSFLNADFSKINRSK